MIRGFLILITVCVAFASFLAMPQPLLAETAKPSPIAENEYLRGTFELARHLNGFEKPLLSRGEFVLSPQHGLIWKTTFPFPGVTVFEEGGIFSVDQNGQRDAMAKGNETRQFVTMISSVLSGNWNPLESQFNISESTAKTKEWNINLTPYPNSFAGSQIELITAQGNAFVQEVVIIKPSSDQDIITFDGQTIEPVPLPTEFNDLFSDGRAK
ncbi:LolA family protein [Thalassospira australica]|uniref:LolA family protein n=1 Tax=Thalassospira australica TaxID=1528106 RepID=UPI00068C0CF3|nr:outer membrane lipoprotein carrier protein LolA [Thalassospira australica]